MNRDAETVPARHATPDLAELRRLLACASPLPWQWEPASGESWPLGDESLVTTSGDPVLYGWGYDASGIDATDADRALIAAAVNALPTLLDHLAHMTEARDNARAEVERLTAKLDAIEADGDKLSIMFGWLVYDVGEHTCGGYGPESGYAHEPGCGFEPVLRLDKLEGWPGEKPLDGRADS